MNEAGNRLSFRADGKQWRRVFGPDFQRLEGLYMFQFFSAFGIGFAGETSEPLGVALN